MSDYEWSPKGTELIAVGTAHGTLQGIQADPERVEVTKPAIAKKYF